jgi:predicted ATPase/DNA-binding SARP family transcriptional activator
VRTESQSGPARLLRIELLGGFRVRTDRYEVDASAWRRRRPAAVVKLLALADGHRLPVDQITSALWPSLDASAARQNLHNALYHARRALQPEPGRDGERQWLVYEDAEVRLDTGPAELEVDVLAFEAAAARALEGAQQERYDAALALHRAGGLLPQDRYEEWAAPRADAVRTLHLELLRGLAGICTARGEHQAAIAALVQAVAVEPFSEESQAQLMRAYTASGQRHLALRQHRRFSELLARELDGIPGPAVQEAHRAARAGVGAAPVRVSAAAVGVSAAPVGMWTSGEAGRLPAPVSRFVGRAADVAAVRGLIVEERLVTLSGPGGVGKTRLAIEAASSQQEAFADGVWFADFSELTDVSLVAQVIARALGVAEIPGLEVREALVRALADRQLLLVLDTCEHVCAGVAELIGELLRRCCSLSVLCTSRQTLQAEGERVYWVPAMRLPDRVAGAAPDPAAMGEAVELFCDRARSVRSSFGLTAENAGQIEEIAVRLEGIPLAIELAAARLKVLSLSDLAAALDDRLPLLGTRSATAVARQQTLRRTIQWSCDLLSPGAARLLSLLSVSPSSWSLEYARAIAAAGELDDDVLELTTELIDKSMLATREIGGSIRYAMLDTVREYVYETLCAEDLSARVHAAHCAAMVALVEQVPSRTLPVQAMSAGWFDRLEVEQANLRAAIDRCLRHSEDKLTALRLCAGLRWFWVERGHFEEGLRAVQGALGLTSDASEGPLGQAIADGHATLALLCWRGGDYARAIESASVALERFEALGDQWGIALSLCVLGMIGQLQGDPLAAAHNEASLIAYRALGDDYGMTWQLLLLAQHGLRTDQLDRAQELAEEGFRVARSAGNPFGEGWALAHLAIVAEARGELAVAADRLERAYEALVREDRWASEAVRVALVRVCALRGDLPAARQHALESLRGFSAMRSSVEFGAALHAVGLIAHCAGDSAVGARLAGAAENLCPLDDVAPVLVGRAALRRDREQIERRLGHAAFVAELEAGRLLRLRDAVTLARAVAG